MDIYQSRMEVFAKFSFEDLINPITQETIIERLEAIDDNARQNQLAH